MSASLVSGAGRQRGIRARIPSHRSPQSAPARPKGEAPQIFANRSSASGLVLQGPLSSRVLCRRTNTNRALEPFGHSISGRQFLNSSFLPPPGSGGSLKSDCRLTDAQHRRDMGLHPTLIWLFEIKRAINNLNNNFFGGARVWEWTLHLIARIFAPPPKKNDPPGYTMWGQFLVTKLTQILELQI